MTIWSSNYLTSFTCHSVLLIAQLLSIVCAMCPAHFYVCFSSFILSLPFSHLYVPSFRPSFILSLAYIQPFRVPFCTNKRQPLTKINVLRVEPSTLPPSPPLPPLPPTQPPLFPHVRYRWREGGTPSAWRAWTRATPNGALRAHRSFHHSMFSFSQPLLPSSLHLFPSLTRGVMVRF